MTQSPEGRPARSPRFPVPLHVGRPNIGDHPAFLGRVVGALERHWLTNNGQLVAELEARLTRVLGVRHCVAVSSGTQGLELAARALDLQGEVIVPAFTFVATAHALQWTGVTPVFCDIDPRTHSLDLSHVESLITPLTTGIVGVHLWGEPCDIDGLESLARRHGLRLLFDAAHAFGVAHHGRMIGGFGDAEVFSFHATKVFNTIEGGAIATNDDDLAARVRLMRNFGFDPSGRVACLGTNAKLNEISAAMGLTNLESLEAFVSVNARNYAAYRRELEAIPGLRLLPHGEDDARNHQYVVAEVDSPDGTVHRDHVLNVLHSENVLARRYYWPGCHRLEPYRSQPRTATLRLPSTERVAERVLVLPTGTGVTEADIAGIGRILRDVMGHTRRPGAAKGA